MRRMGRMGKVSWCVLCEGADGGMEVGRGLARWPWLFRWLRVGYGQGVGTAAGEGEGRLRGFGKTLNGEVVLNVDTSAGGKAALSRSRRRSSVWVRTGKGGRSCSASGLARAV